ncbi:hypothetical protein CAFE_17750 [Caprobacter fermentans]|uniref:Uncharacterized protein n=2 Tax=Caproicibacter fermentans TaxID=2576756 RepID=A0A6N8I0J3_9FIRM|nr:hypothetical protein [Caproicibacter fermentans]
MIKLLVPAMIGGRMIPAGRVTAAPEALEKKLIAAGNARREPAMENLEFEQAVKEAEAELEKKEIAKSAETSQAGTAAETETSGETAAAPDLNLGRSGVQAK